MVREHANCVVVDGVGVLLRGPSASGKSDLSLRLIDAGAQLVADDYTQLELRDGRVVASAPAAIAGMIEVRGIGLVKVSNIASAEIGVVIDLMASDSIERAPAPAVCTYLGVQLPLYAVAALESSAIVKVRLALDLARGRCGLVS